MPARLALLVVVLAGCAAQSASGEPTTPAAPVVSEARSAANGTPAPASSAAPGVETCAAEVPCGAVTAPTRSVDALRAAYEGASERAGRRGVDAPGMSPIEAASILDEVHAHRCLSPSPELLYFEARVLERAERVAAASTLFERVAADPAAPDELARFAVDLALDTTNRTGATAVCRARLARLAGLGLGRFCAPPTPGVEEACARWAALADLAAAPPR